MKKKKYSDLATTDMKNVEIFEVGTNETMDYSVADLEAMAMAGQELENEIKPPLKLGHNEDQEWTDGLPAVGWIANLRKFGNKLMADIKNVPKKLANVIKAGGYRRVSVEIGKNYQSESGRIYPNVIRALSLLGADIPRVKTLKDIVSLYSEGDNNKFEKTDKHAFSRFAQQKNGGNKMNTIEITRDEYSELVKAKTELEKLQTKVKEAETYSEKVKTDLETRNEEIKKLQDKVSYSEKNAQDLTKKIKEQEDKMSEAKKARKIQKIDSFINERKDAGAWKPAWDDSFKEEAMALDDEIEHVVKYKENDVEKEVKRTQLDKHLNFLRNSVPEKSVKDFSEISKDGKVKEKTSEGMVNSDLDAKARKYMEQHKDVDYTNAVLAVASGKDSI